MANKKMKKQRVNKILIAVITAIALFNVIEAISSGSVGIEVLLYSLGIGAILIFLSWAIMKLTGKAK
jgi:hypothetical protein